MAKTQEVVIDALEDIIVQAEESDIPQSEAKTAIRILNDMMLSWAALGIDLGYTVVQDMGDLITVPAGALRGIKANLAIELAPKYDAAITASLVKRAKDGYEACLNLAVEIGAMVYPSTLPRGSGNSYPGYADDKFYPEQQSTILTETGGAIALEEDTE